MALGSPVFLSLLLSLSSPSAASARTPSSQNGRLRAEDAPARLFVHREGDDATADGTREHPFRSITAALAAGRTEGVAPRIAVDLGTYDADHGERFPLDLTGGVVLLGMGSGLAVIEAGDAEAAVRLGAEAPGRAVLSGVTVHGSGVGIALGALPEGVSGARALALRDVELKGLGTGIAIDLGTTERPAPVDLRADGLRAHGCATGIRALGVGHLALAVADSAFSDGELGIELENDPAEDVRTPREPDEEGVARAWHDVSVSGTRFERLSQAGFLRVGRDGRNRGGPYRFSDSLFEDAHIGIELRRPCADAAVQVDGCRFLGNELFGLQWTGYIGADADAAASTSRIQGCLFRWNGVGAHVTSCELPLAVSRSRFLDNLGNGLFVSNLLTDPTTVRIEDSLFGGNGSHGIYSLADFRRQTVTILGCTVVDNAEGGIRDHRRHSGVNALTVRGSILDGNGAANDLAGVDPTAVSASWVGASDALDAEAAARGIRTGADPGLVDREAGDFHPAPGAPVLAAWRPAPEDAAAPVDLDGQPRPADAPWACGALEPRE